MTRLIPVLSLVTVFCTLSHRVTPIIQRKYVISNTFNFFLPLLSQTPCFCSIQHSQHNHYFIHTFFTLLIITSKNRHYFNIYTYIRFTSYYFIDLESKYNCDKVVKSNLSFILLSFMVCQFRVVLIKVLIDILFDQKFPYFITH